MLDKHLKQYQIILASKSPRRKELLNQLNIPYKCKTKSIEEIYPNHLKAAEITDYLALLKAKNYESELQDKDLLITSDTIVWFDGKALGKPKSKEEAFDMLRAYSGKKHTVITSICLYSKEKTEVFHDTTTVYFKTLSDSEISYYLETDYPGDKAGSYGIQDWIGLIGIERIDGSYFNVMGLPVHKLYKELLKY